MTKSVFFFTLLAGVGFLCPAAFSQNPPPTATYTASNQTVTLTGLGGSNGVGESLVQWGTCAYDGKNTNCTVTAPYTGVGGGGTITIVLSYAGNGSTPFTATSISAGSNYVTFGLLANNSGKITVSLQESTGANITFLSDNFQFFYSTESCTGLAAGAQCSVSDVGLTQGATITGPVYGTFDATPAIVDAINASSYGSAPTVAPATWMEIYGTNLANVASQTWGSADFNGTAGPTILGATSVTISGQTAVVEYVSPVAGKRAGPFDGGDRAASGDREYSWRDQRAVYDYRECHATRVAGASGFQPAGGAICRRVISGLHDLRSASGSDQRCDIEAGQAG